MAEKQLYAVRFAVRSAVSSRKQWRANISLCSLKCSVFSSVIRLPAAGWALLTAKAGAGHAETRALAGTRKRSEGGEWSAKNLAEHRMVTDDMCRRIEELTLEPRLGQQYNFAYGNIEHLCTPIEIRGDLDGVSLHRLIRAIHPTPAVGGYPREKALSDIDAIEHWPRNCYGGHISVRHGSETIVYIALRCVHFDAVKWAVYTGSGITPDSDAADEWLETETKAAPLISILSHYSF